MKKLVFFFGIALTCSLMSCADDPCDDTEQAEADSNALIQAALDYAFNPSTATCEVYRDILEDYLDKYGDCDGVDQSGIEESRQSLADLPCR